MTFTYAGSLATDKEKVRFYIGDVTSGSGPKPADGNFTDEEITALITLEGSWQRAVAACYEALASLWAKHQSFTADGVQMAQTSTSLHYRALIKEWRDRYGYATGTGYQGNECGTVAITRIDGYSYDIDNHDTDDDDYTSADYLL